MFKDVSSRWRPHHQASSLAALTSGKALANQMRGVENYVPAGIGALASPAMLAIFLRDRIRGGLSEHQ